MNRKQRRAAKKQSRAVRPGANHTAASNTSNPTGDLFSRGVAHHEAGRLDEAAQLYRRLLARDPDHAEGRYHLGGVFYQKSDWPEAARHLEKAVALYPDYVEALNVLGVVYKNLGRLPEAQDCLNRAVALRPAFADARCNLGNVLLKLERLDEAERHYREAVRLDPGMAVAHSNLGATLLKKKNYTEAVESLKKAVALAPGYAEAHNNLGVACKEQDKPEEAVGHYRKALELNPDFADAHNNLGNALVSLKRNREAVEHFRRAIDLGLNKSETLTNLGTALNDENRYEEALRVFEEALALTPGNAVAYNNMGNTLNLLGKADEAIAHFRKSLEIAPHYAEAINNLGIVHFEQGRIAEAIALFQKTLETDPNYTRAYRNIGTFHKYEPNDAFAEALLEKAQDMDSLTEDAQIHLRYALGKYYQDIGDFDPAFENFDAGATLKRKTIDYDPDAVETVLEKVGQFFRPGPWTHAEGYGVAADVPVFVLGMPRSGTTLVEQILAAHPAVHGAGELKEFERAFKGFRATRNLFTPGSDDARDLTARGARYFAALRAMNPNAARVTDKMPFNFMNIGLIHLALPGAKIIHCRRNPLDTCVSCFTTFFSEPIDWSYDLAETGQFYAAYAAMMEHWHDILPGRILDVDYEDVVADTEGQARRIVAHCGLEWDEACLNFQNAKRAVRTASAGQVRKPIYTSSLERWRRYEKHLAPLRDALEPVLAKRRAA